MIQIKPTNISDMEAFRIADHVLEKYSDELSGIESVNHDGLVGVTHYSVNKSKAGNIFIRIWMD